MNEQSIRYCALTTLSLNLRAFVLPSALYLAEKGYDVTVGCKRDDTFAQSLAGKPVKYLPLGIERGFSVKGTLVGIWQLYRFFRRNKIQMVEYGTENVSFCGAVASWLARVPVRIYNHWGARYVGYPKGWVRSFSLFVEKTTARLSTDVRQASELNRQMCISDGVYPAEKVKVLGYGGTVGADFSCFDIQKKSEYSQSTRAKLGIGPDDFIFGDICWIRKDKGSNELIEAFRRIGQRNAWLLLVGDIYKDDPVGEDLMNWAMASDRVIFTGRVLDVEHYVAAMDVLVHPSYREGLGLVLQEAGAMGVPCITTDIIGPKEFGIPGQTGLLVKKADADDLYEKMLYFYQDRSRLESFSKAVYAMVKERYERGVMLERIGEDRADLWKNHVQK